MRAAPPPPPAALLPPICCGRRRRQQARAYLADSPDIDAATRGALGTVKGAAFEAIAFPYVSDKSAELSGIAERAARWVGFSAALQARRAAAAAGVPRGCMARPNSIAGCSIAGCRLLPPLIFRPARRRR